MDIIIKLLHTIFFGTIFFIVFMRYNNFFPLKNQYIIALLLYLIGLLYLNTVYIVIPNKLLFVLIIFSLSIMILNFIKKFINIENSSILKSNNHLRGDYKNIKKIIFEKIIPIMIFFYQILLIWFPIIFEKMSQK